MSKDAPERGSAESDTTSAAAPLSDPARERLKRAGDRLRILVLETDAMLAAQIRLDLRSRGCFVLGPAATLSAARQLAPDADAAILDLWIDQQSSFELAQSFRDSARPFLFHTDHTPDALPEELTTASLFRKPVPTDLLLEDLILQQSRAQPAPLALIPELRLVARRLLGDRGAADRMIETVLRDAVPAVGQKGDAELRDWLLERLWAEARRNGRRHLN